MIEIRKTAPEEYRAASAVVGTALLHAPANDEDWEKDYVTPSWDGSDSLSAWDGDRCVGNAAGYRFDTLVPGGAWLPTSGVTRVGVLATHRRQGLLRRMLTQLLQEAAERGQVLASLRASETPIYQRFGFGLAGESAESVLVPATALPITGAAAGTFRLLQPDQVLETVKPIYERAATRPGVLRRPEWMWMRYLENARKLGGDAEFVVVHTSTDGIDDGFVHYAVKWKQERGTPAQGDGEVYELWGCNGSVELALWTYLCNVDLIREWYLEERPTDDLVRLAIADSRSYRTRWVWDEQWLRLLDVDAALTARGYADHSSAFTVAVADEMLPANTGVWEISAAGAKRTGTDPAQADLAVDIRTLSAAYLGGPTWTSLADASRVHVRSAGALRTADALFWVPRAPYCCSGF
jgi:predicted acetyltransferase